MGPSLPIVKYGEREFEFRPLSSVAAPDRPTEEPVDTRLSFISGAFGRTGAPTMGEASAPDQESMHPRSRWGVGYIAGVGPTELVDESPPVEVTGARPAYEPVPLPASHDFRGLASLALAAMVLMIVGVAWFVTTSSARATVQTNVKVAPPPAVQRAPSTQLLASVPSLANTQPPAVAASQGPVRHYVTTAKSVSSAPAAQPPVVQPPVVQPPAPVTPPSSKSNGGDSDHHAHGAMSVWHHDRDGRHHGDMDH